MAPPKPKLWASPPSAIISIYGPTDIHHLPPKDPFGAIETPLPTSEMLKSATSFDNPPSNTPVMTEPGDWLNGRTKLAILMFRMGAVADFLLRGLTKSKNVEGETEYAFPQTGQATETEIGEISPLHLSRKFTFPPTYQIIGSKDSLFDLEHVTRLAAALEEQGISHHEHVVEGADHAFDMTAPIGGDIHQTVVKPVVAWVRRLV